MVSAPAELEEIKGTYDLYPRWTEVMGNLETYHLLLALKLGVVLWD